MSDFVLDKTKATAEGRQWESTKLERITNNATFVAGGQCDQCAGLLVGYQPLGSMPSLRSLSRQAFFTHELKLPGPATSLICCNNVSSKRMFFFVLPERSNFGFTFSSCIGTYHRYKLKSNGTYHIKNTQPLNTAKPGSAGTLTGLLTTNDSKIIEVAMRNHTTHPQGRDSHNLNKCIWHFITFGASEPQIIHVTAWTEREARNRCPSGCVAVFAARIRQEVRHA
ncbi:host cell division inhibitor Icd-like protein [Escherichia coli]|nr:host cell division inhibitor Icd-like protein [Escherichia coli]EHP5999745.1 host cell division inhibitor Icd-like protein [Escherichia coli]EHT3077635.1 host cell division inhibitor Icd-like protein [Escherichia coli]EHT6512719.1 host cell division inhibitor Icd-like protein [Escherichia coli]EHT6627447.1 host cell division inhibitor Icd-like protein [Escherichia coli]